MLIPRQANFEASRFRRLGFSLSALAFACSSLTAVVGVQVATSDRAGASSTAPSVGVGQAPRAVAVDSSTNMIYVANSDDNNVSVINGATNAVVGSPIHVGNAPYAIAVDSTTHKIYVSNSGDNSISVISGAASPPVVVATIASTGGMGVAVNSVTHTIFGVNPSGYRCRGSVSIIDESNNAVVGLVEVGANPFPIAVNAATNMVYVANSYDSTVSVIDDSANPPAVVATIGVGSTPFGIAVNSATNTIYSAGYYGQDTTVIDGASSSVTATIGGAQFPAGIAVDEATNTVYTMSQNSGQIQVINGEDNTVSSTVSACNTGWCLGGIAFNSTNHTVYATNIPGNSVSVLSASVAPTISNLPISGLIGDSFTPSVQQSGSNLAPHSPAQATTITSSTPATCYVNGDGSVSYTAAGTCTLVSHVAAAQTTIGSDFQGPYRVAVDTSDNVYVADYGHSRVVKVDPTGNQSAFGSDWSYPLGVALDAAGNVYVADTNNNRIVKVTPAGNRSTIEPGFNDPYRSVVDASGNLFVASWTDSNSNFGHLYKLTPAGNQSTIGSDISNPADVALDAAGNVYVADTNNNRIVKVTPTGNQSTIGSEFSYPNGVAVDASGNVYVADYGHSRVVKVTPAGTQTTIGSGFHHPTGVTIDASGKVYVADYENNRVVEVSPQMDGAAQSFAITPAISNIPSSATVGGSFTPVALGATSVTSSTPLVCSVDLDGSVSYLKAGTCTLVPRLASMQTTIASGLTNPEGVAIDSSGNVYVADSSSHQVDELSPDGFGGYSKSVIGSGFSYPTGVALDSSGNLYVATGDAVQELVPNGQGGFTEATIATGFVTQGVALDSSGNVYVGNNGNGDVYRYVPSGGGYSQTTIGSGFSNQQGLAVDYAGNVLVADYGHLQVVKLSPDGSGGYSRSTVGPNVTVYQLSVDGSGNVLVPDYDGGQVTQVTPSGDQTVIATGLSPLAGVTSDAAGNLFVARSCCVNQIEMITPAMQGTPQSFTVTRLTPTMPTITNIPSDTPVNGSFTALVSTTSTGVVHVISNAGGVCTVTNVSNSYRVNFIGPGTCSLTASVMETGTFDGASGTAQTFSVHATPLAPTNVTATAGMSQATVHWINPTPTPPARDAAVANRVWIGSNGSWSPASSTASGGANSYTVTGLSGNTDYLFKVIAIDAGGYQTSSNTTARSVTPGPFTPRAPQGLFMAPGQQSTTLTWANPASNGDATLHNKVAYSTNNETWITANAALSPSTTSYTVSGLNNGKHYWFEVIALDSANHESPADRSATFVTPQPNAPNGASGISVVAGVKTAKVSWTNPSSNGDPCSYNVVSYSTDGSSWIKSSNVGATATSLTVSGLSRSTSYYFQIVAFDSSGRAGTPNRTGNSIRVS